jgi:hypothetical protein
MSTCTVAGTITFPVLTGGPNASAVIGAPSVTPTTATTGHQVTYNEGVQRTLKIAALGTQVVSFDGIAAGNFVYVGCSQAVEVTVDGSDTSIDLTAGGFIIISKAGITSLSITAGVVEAEVSVIVLGD